MNGLVEFLDIYVVEIAFLIDIFTPECFGYQMFRVLQKRLVGWLREHCYFIFSVSNILVRVEGTEHIIDDLRVNCHRRCLFSGKDSGPGLMLGQQLCV